jgi:hypothetical protein
LTGIGLTGLISGSGSFSGTAFGQTPRVGRGRQVNIVGVERGDPDAPPETLVADRSKIEQLYAGPVTKGVPKDEREVARRMLEIARGFTHPPPPVSRETNPNQVRQFLKLFGFDLRYTPKGRYVPYCASGVSFAACQAYCDVVPADRYDTANPNLMFRRVLPDINRYYFKPSPSCAEMVKDAKRRKAWLPLAQAAPSDIQPGWLVFYDWDGAGVANHVGIVDSAHPDVLHTVEFNTSAMIAGSQINGGAVAEKVRPYRYVLGYIKMY